MAPRDFRGFLALLETSGELRTVDEEISLAYDLAGRVKAAEARENPAWLFRNVRGHTIPVAAGLYGSTPRHLLGLRMTSMDEFADRLRAAINRPLEPVEVDASEAPAREVVYPPEFGLDRFPIPVHFPGDAGPYITSGVVTLQVAGRRNAGVYRVQVHGPRELTIFVNRFKDGARALEDAERRGTPVDVAISIGVDPAVFVAAMWPAPSHVDEFGAAGALMGEPLAITRGLTVGVAYPAHAELVIEGRIRPGNTRWEGPFADITVQSTSAGWRPVIDVLAVTSRRNPIYHTVLACDSREHFKSRNNDFWRDYQTRGRLRIPELEALGACDVYFPPAGVNFHAIVAVRTHDAEVPQKVMDVMFRTFRYLKQVIVVDADVDIRDHTQVEWAVATRVGRSDQLVMTTGPGSALDTSSEGDVLKLGIDATVRTRQSISNGGDCVA
jgi:2,5-furandicarboxylate decarboxylase 1